MQKPRKGLTGNFYWIFISFLFLFGHALAQKGLNKTQGSLDTLALVQEHDKLLAEGQKFMLPKYFDTTKSKPVKRIVEKDMKEFTHDLFQPHKPYLEDTTDVKFTKKHYSFVPAIGYSEPTGFAVLISANAAYYTDNKPDSKISNIQTSLTYSQYQQIIFPVTASIWTKNNTYNWITDFRFLSYPSAIYGLGGRVDPDLGVNLNFNGVKLHQSLMRCIANNLYLGIGYYLDAYWNIRVTDSLSKTINRIVDYRLGSEELASGPSFKFVFDSRLNSINPKQGIYASATFRSNFQALGSNHNNQILQLDARTYIRFPARSQNVLSFWTLGWFVTGGSAPYLLLPSTGWDDQYNSGRGINQGRYRGKRMYYQESEYRFNITRNGLLGGVAFLNLETFSPDLSATYNKLFPGYGAGIRLKINKHSGTNLCVDYGFSGSDQKGNVWVNLGEVF